MARITVAVALLMALIYTAMCKPVEEVASKAQIIHEAQISDEAQTSGQAHRVTKRFVNPALTDGSFINTGFSKMRTKRSLDEECEKLSLCKLHAQSTHNFLAAFELYFVNRENARLWDHHARSMAACRQRYSECYEE